MPRVIRHDLHRLDAVEVTASGALRVPARLARVGVLPYEDGQGGAWGELVPPETLFDPASLATARGIAVVDLHPGALVTPETYAALAKGHVGDDVKRDGDYLVAPVYVTDATEIQRVKDGQRKDVSCGYTCDLDETPGVFDGQAYRAVQRGRVYNHLGLGPEGWGRAGADVALRLDGGGAVTRLDATTGGAVPPTTTEGRMAAKTKKDGDETPAVDTPKTDADVEMIPKKDADEKEAEHLAKIETLEKLCAEMARTIAELKAGEGAEVTEAEVPESVADSIVSKRLAKLDAAREGARSIAPAVKLDGLLKPREIHAQAIAAVLPAVKLDGLSDDAVAGMFTGLVEGAKSKQTTKRDGDAKIAAVLAPDAAQADAIAKQDAQDVDPIEAQRAKMRAWGKAPLNTPKAS